jgi:ribosome biogenesis GTPase
MHPLSVEGFVVDTPGLRDVGLWGLEPMEVMSAFPEIVAQAPDCRFDDCRHMAEPGCAVADAVTTGDVAESRLRSYRRLLDEAVQAARQW